MILSFFLVLFVKFVCLLHVFFVVFCFGGCFGFAFFWRMLGKPPYSL